MTSLTDDIVDPFAVGQKILTGGPERQVGPARTEFDASTTTPLNMVPTALLQEENMIGSFFANQLGDTGEVDENFKYEERLTPDLEPYSAYFVTSKNALDFDQRRQNIERQMRNRKVLGDHPLASFAFGLGLAPVDPINFIPGGYVFSKVKAGTSILNAAKAGALSNMASNGIAEAALLSQQETRTFSEAATGTMASGLLGGILGGSAEFLARSLRAKAEQEVTQSLAGTLNENMTIAGAKDQTLQAYDEMGLKMAARDSAAVFDEKFAISNPYNDSLPSAKPEVGRDFKLSDVGAAEKSRETLAEEAKAEAIVGVGGKVAKASFDFNPIISLSNSDAPTSRRAAQEIFGMYITREKNKFINNAQPNQQSLELFVQASVGKTRSTLAKIDEMFLEQAGIQGSLFGRTRQAVAQKLGNNKGLRDEDFYTGISESIRNGFNHDSEAVNKAARLVHKEVIERLYLGATEAGLLPKNLERRTAENYLTRLYNKNLIRERRPEFAATIRPWLVQTNEQLIALMPKIEAKRAEVTSAKRELTVQRKRSEKIAKLDKKLRDDSERSLKRQIERKKAAIEVRKTPKAKGRAEGELAALKKKYRDMQKEYSRLKRELERNSVENAEARLKALQDELDSHDFVPPELRHSDGSIRKPLEQDSILDDGRIVQSSQINENVDQIIANILGDNAGRLVGTIGQAARGGRPTPLKNMAFLIPDEMIAEWTTNDIRRVLESYTDMMAPHIEVARMGQTLGVKGKKEKQIAKLLDEKQALRDKFDEVEEPSEKELSDYVLAQDELDARIRESEQPSSAQDLLDYYYDELRSEYDILARGKSGPEVGKIEDRFEKDMNNIKFGLETITGAYDRASGLGIGTVQFMNNMKKFNAGRLMGGVVLPSTVDIGHVVARMGYGETLNEIANYFSKDIASVSNKQTLQDIGFALNKYNSMLQRSMYEIEETSARPTRFTKAADFFSNSIFTLSGQNRWQDAVQTIIGSASMSRTLRAIDNWKTTGKMEASEAKRLNALGIAKDHWDVIHQQWQDFGGKSKGGSYYINYGNMDMEIKEVSQAYRSFMNGTTSEIVSTIIEPGKGDVPKLMHNPFVSVATQFKRFNATSHTKALVSHLSNEEANLYSGISAMLGVGAMSYIVQSYIRDGGQTLDLSPDNVLSEAIDRSGFISMIWGSKNLAQKAFGFGTNVRYNSRGIFGALAGPTVGLTEDTVSLINRLIAAGRDPLDEKHRDFTTKDAKLFLRMMPYQNLFYLSYLNRKATKNLALTLGAEEREGL